MVPGCTSTGLSNVTVCQPEAVSPLNVAWARRCPPAVQRLPLWLPVFAVYL